MIIHKYTQKPEDPTRQRDRGDRVSNNISIARKSLAFSPLDIISVKRIPLRFDALARSPLLQRISGTLALRERAAVEGFRLLALEPAVASAEGRCRVVLAAHEAAGSLVAAEAASTLRCGHAALRPVARRRMHGLRCHLRLEATWSWVLAELT